MQEKDLSLLVEAISNEKNITKESVLKSLELAMSKTIRKHQGINAKVVIESKGAEIRTLRLWQVVENGEKFVDDEGTMFDETLHIYEEDANGMEVGDFVEKEIPNCDFGRIGTLSIKQEVYRGVREEANRSVAKTYSEKVGDVVTGKIKKVMKNAIAIDLGGVDGIIGKKDQSPYEFYKKDEQIKVFIKSVDLEDNGRVRISLSRIANEMIYRLFEMEIPEISEGVVEIKAIARIPGIRAKVVVNAKDSRIDPVGACIGMRGSRIQAIKNELSNENIDLVIWDDDFVKYVMNVMSPVIIKSISIDEELGTMEVAVQDDQLSLAIGKSGQNIKLTSKLLDSRVSVISQSELMERELEDERKSKKKLKESLDIDDNVVDLLFENEITDLESIIEAEEGKIAKIEGFTQENEEDLREMAMDAQMVDSLKNMAIVDELVENTQISETQALILAEAGVTDMESIADLSVSELMDIELKTTESQAAELILAARKHQGWI